MPTYTTLLQSSFDHILPEDDNFIEELLGVAQLFRPFSEGLDEFIASHGYSGAPEDIKGKVAFIRDAFARAGMAAPRELEKWYTESQPIRRDTVFQLCFAFGLDGVETDEFFRRVYARERSFDCHRVQEAVYYFCLNNGMDYASAQAICARLPEPPAHTPGQTAVYTASIMAELNRMESPEALVRYLTDNIALFSRNNVTAYQFIQSLWAEVSGENGLVMREFRRFYMMGDDIATGGERTSLRKSTRSPGASVWERYLFIFQLDKARVKGLGTDRTLKPIIEFLHESARDSFPDRQGIEAIVAGRAVSYERVRKWLILLAFYVFWARKRLETGSDEAEAQDGTRCTDTINHYLLDAGYSTMYVGNPYDWLFFYVAQQYDPLACFREIWNELLDRAAGEDTDKPNPRNAGIE